MQSYRIDLDNEMIMLDSSCYCHYDRVLEYALAHNYSVMCTEVKSSLFADTCLAFQQAGFHIEFKQISKQVYGLEIEHVVAIFHIDRPRVGSLTPVMMAQLSSAIEGSYIQAKQAAQSVSLRDREAWVAGSKDMHDRVLKAVTRML